MTFGLLACGGRLHENRPEPEPVVSGGASGGGGQGVTAGSAGAVASGAGGAGGVHVDEAAAGEAAGAAPGGAAGAGPCDGVEPSCEPGEAVCDPLAGRLTSCGACGTPLPADGGATCVRLLASDKESNGVCVVRGATELQCLPIWGEPSSGEVPSGTVELMLPDDYASLNYPLVPQICSRRADSGFSCMRGGAECAKGALGDAGAFCIICSGELYCEGSTLVPSLVAKPLLSVTITDLQAFLLSPAGVQTSLNEPVKPPFWMGVPRSMSVDHEGAGCMESSLGEVACFNYAPSELEASPWRGPFRKLVLTTYPHACVLDAARRVSCGDIIADAEPQPLLVDRVVDVVASAGLVCALTVDGHVSCYDNQGEPREVPAGW